MLTIKVDTFEELEKIHKSLVGLQAYIDNDIVVTQNIDRPGGEVIINRS